MKTIWKFEAPVDDEVSIWMPQGAKVIAVGCQHERSICVWAIVDPEAQKLMYGLHIRGTGHPLGSAEDADHMGVVFDGPFVWHVFIDKHARDKSGRYYA